MLVLTRCKGDRIIIGTGADAVTVTVLETKGGNIRIGITAPQHVRVDRAEVREAMDAERINKGAKRHA